MHNTSPLQFPDANATLTARQSMDGDSEIQVTKLAIKYSPPTLVVQYVRSRATMVKSIKIKTSSGKVDSSGYSLHYVALMFAYAIIRVQRS